MDNFLLNAIFIATEAHKGQKRKYTNEPYISHPFSVAGLVSSVSRDEDMIVAALLHDTVEDTHIEISTIKGLFGVRVAEMVEDLTDVSQPEDGNRKVRKAIDREHTARASVDSKTIKLADLIDNTKTIVAFDREFAKVYMNEKRKLLEVLTDGDKLLFDVANGLVEQFYST